MLAGRRLENGGALFLQLAGEGNGLFHSTFSRRSPDVCLLQDLQKLFGWGQLFLRNMQKH